MMSFLRSGAQKRTKEGWPLCVVETASLIRVSWLPVACCWVAPRNMIHVRCGLAHYSPVLITLANTSRPLTTSDLQYDINRRGLDLAVKRYNGNVFSCTQKEDEAASSFSLAQSGSNMDYASAREIIKSIKGRRSRVLSLSSLC